jgi:hypothetical protein
VPNQRNVPALVIPYRGRDGGVVAYQLRPDTPRRKRRTPGDSSPVKFVKYESPPKNRLHLAPLTRDLIDDPKVPLLLPESVIKADSLSSWVRRNGIKAAVVGQNGCWGWKATNEKGGRVACSDLHDIPFNGRHVLLVPDGDVRVKKGVNQATAELLRYLEQKQAKVTILSLPDDEDGNRLGIDDLLKQNPSITTLEDLLEFAIRDDERARGDYSVVKAQFEQRFEVIKKLHRVWDAETETLIRAKDLKEITGAHFTYRNAEAKRKPFPAEWLQDAARLTRDDLAFQPGEPAETDNCRNLWRGWPANLAKGM